jgi:hypothetical protein
MPPASTAVAQVRREVGYQRPRELLEDALLRKRVP